MKAELTIKGMKCSNCANKVEKILREHHSISTAFVNLITDKVFIALKNADENSHVIEEIKSILGKSGFTVINVNLETNKKDYKNRIMTVKLFLIDDNKSVQNLKRILEEINMLTGVEHITRSEKIYTEKATMRNDRSNIYYVIKIEYDPLLIKGINLHSKVEEILANTNQQDQLVKNNFDSERNLIGITVRSNILENQQLFPKYQNQFKINMENINMSHKPESIKNFIFCLFLTAFMMYLTMLDDSVVAEYLKSFYIEYRMLNLYLFSIVIISVILIIKYGVPIYKRAFVSYFNEKMLNMESLITLGSISALILTIISVFKSINMSHEGIHGITHSIEAAATVVSIASIGKFIEDRAKNNIRNQKKRLFESLKNKKRMKCKWIRLRNRNFVVLEEKETDVGLIERDDLIKLQKNDYLMVEGVIVHGEIEIKEDVTLGYDVIQKKRKGDKVKAGCEIINGECILMVEEVLENSLLCKLTEEVSSNLNQKLKFQNFLEKIIKYFVPFIIFLAILTFLVWMVIFLIFNENSEISFTYVIERPIAILVVSCPCAFGLAIPTVVTIGLNLGLKSGILIKNVSILSEVKDTDIFIFDKTGTLTDVSREVKIEYEYIGNHDENSANKIKDLPIFDIIAEIEKNQKHPIAQTLYSFCMKKENLRSSTNTNINAGTISNFTTSSIKIESNGIKAVCKIDIHDYEICIGNMDFVTKEKKLDYSDIHIQEIINKCTSELKLSLCYVTINNFIAVIFSIDSSSYLRPEAEFVINYLQTDLKKEVFILSGDSVETVLEVGRKLKITPERCLGGIDNISKKEILQKLKNSDKNKKILMIGDGINDVLSISEADIGISFNTHSNLNLIASDIIFIKNDLRLILNLLKLSKLSLIFIIINIFWAFIYNLCMIPITAGVLYSLKIEISPTLSSFSMLCSSLLILITSNILRLFKLNYAKHSNTQSCNLIEESVEIKSSNAGIYVDNSINSSKMPNQPKKIKRNKEVYQQISSEK